MDNKKSTLVILAVISTVSASAFTGDENIKVIKQRLASYPELVHVGRGELPSSRNINEARDILLGLKKLTNETGFPKVGKDYRNIGGGGDGSSQVTFYLEQPAPAQVSILGTYAAELIDLKHDIIACEPYQDLSGEARAQKLDPTPMRGGAWDANRPRRGCFSRTQIKELKPHYNAVLSVLGRILNGMIDQLPVSVSSWERKNFSPLRAPLKRRSPGKSVEVRRKPPFIATPNTIGPTPGNGLDSSPSVPEQDSSRTMDIFQLEFTKGRSDISVAAKKTLGKAAGIIRRGEVSRISLFYSPASDEMPSASKALALARGKVIMDLLMEQKVMKGFDIRVSNSSLPDQILEMRLFGQGRRSLPDADIPPAPDEDGFDPAAHPALLR